MNLVAEQDRAAAFYAAALLGLADDLAHARHTLRDGAERHELLVRVVGEQLRERRLAAAGRSPEHHARDRAALDRVAQRLAFAEQLLVAQELVERRGPKPIRERRFRRRSGGFCRKQRELGGGGGRQRLGRLGAVAAPERRADHGYPTGRTAAGAAAARPTRRADVRAGGFGRRDLVQVHAGGGVLHSAHG